MIDRDAFTALFDSFRQAAFRYEGLPAYLSDDEVDDLKAWRAGHPQQVRSVRNSQWMRRMAATTAAGKRWSRVRAVDQPLPDYLRFEASGYIESQAVGEEILMVDREHAPARTQDFWLFDGGTPDAVAAVMNYSDAGEWLGVEIVRDADMLTDLQETRLRLVAMATPLNAWLAKEQMSPLA